MNITKMKPGDMISTDNEYQSLKSSSMEWPLESFGMITKFGSNMSLKSSGMMENSPPFSPQVPHGETKQAPPGGWLEDTSTHPKMLARQRNNSSISSPEVITNFYLALFSTLFVKNCSIIKYNETLQKHV